ncbi:MAG: hypothetical protein ACRD40_04280 [Candidatus Acidiferrales bacterium]
MERRRQRLAEAIAWCALQKLQNNPLESEDVKRRRALGERAANHAFAAHQLKAASPFKWVTRGKVKKMKDEALQMLAEANLEAIRPLAEQLRNPALRPTQTLRECKTREDRVALIEELSESRARSLTDSGKYPEIHIAPVLGGQILRYAPERSRGDRAPSYESKGFYDADSCPPWDTWVWFAADELISYVPRLVCGLAQHGLEVDTAECLRWADTAFKSTIFGL